MRSCAPRPPLTWGDAAHSKGEKDEAMKRLLAVVTTQSPPTDKITTQSSAACDTADRLLPLGFETPLETPRTSRRRVLARQV